MEFLNTKEGLSPYPDKPTKLTVDMGDWTVDDPKLKKLLDELPYPAFCLYIPKHLRPVLEDLIKRSLNNKVIYGQSQDF